MDEGVWDASWPFIEGEAKAEAKKRKRPEKGSTATTIGRSPVKIHRWKDTISTSLVFMWLRGRTLQTHAYGASRRNINGFEARPLDACDPGRGYPVAGSTAWQQEQAQPRTKGVSFLEGITRAQTCIHFMAFDISMLEANIT